MVSLIKIANSTRPFCPAKNAIPLPAGQGLAAIRSEASRPMAYVSRLDSATVRSGSGVNHVRQPSRSSSTPHCTSALSTGSELLRAKLNKLILVQRR